MTRTMSGLPSPLVSSFSAELAVTSHASCSIVRGSESGAGAFVVPSLAPPPQAPIEQPRSVIATTNGMGLALFIGPWVALRGRVRLHPGSASVGASLDPRQRNEQLGTTA